MAEEDSAEERYLYAYFACFDAIATGCCVALLARQVVSSGRAREILTWLTTAGMTFVYLSWPIGESNVLGVTAIAFGTAALLLAPNRADRTTIRRTYCWSTAIEGCGRLSYELYLFHLIVLGSPRAIIPSASVAGDEKLALLARLSVALCLARCSHRANLLGTVEPHDS
jgi:peptidoglycan/LPS O-acetylase OafA/YrhL